MNTMLDFSTALQHIKLGKKVRRSIWAPTGEFVFLVNGSKFAVNRPPLLGIFVDGTVIDYNPHIDIRLADGSIAVWPAPQLDILATDWEFA